MASSALLIENFSLKVPVRKNLQQVRILGQYRVTYRASAVPHHPGHDQLTPENCFKIVRVFASTNQKHYPDLGSNTLATSFHVETTGGVVVSRNVGCFLKLAKC